MKQIEITVRLNEKIEEAISKLKKNGFKKIRESDIDDTYLSNLNIKMKKENIQEFLKHSVLLRKLKLNGKEIKKITYKNKELDNNGDVISEQKVNLNCDDLIKAENLFNCLGFYNLIEVKYHVIVYEKNGNEFAFQIVENLGILIEYENVNDFEGKSVIEINKAKNEMLEYIKACNINITDEYDVKKAFELIDKKYNL
ncbi:uncharacterized protein MJ0240 [Clostridium sp. CAG:1219]|nr:uncharacterized protein MJ0240 [Clostridium sp. CAG:1219]